MLALIAAAEGLAMTLWFSATAATPALVAEFGMTPGQTAWVTMAVQGGFVLGTLGSAILNLPDLLSTRRVFALGCLAGAVATFGVAAAGSPAAIVAARGATGAALALVYPTGMKLAAGWFERQRGTAIAVIVASLTVGQAFPHLVAALAGALPWRTQLMVPVTLALVASVAVLTCVAEGPYRRDADRFDAHAAMRLFTNPVTRLAALGYFGHMWELYAMWAWIATATAVSYAATLPLADAERMAKLTAFLAIGSGGIACIAAGLVGDRVGKAETAAAAMIVSGASAILVALTFGGPAWLTLALVIVWGLSVVPDSAQFSALVADAAPPEVAGSLLTFQTALGFALTFATVQVVPQIAIAVGWPLVLAGLALGPAVGIVAMLRLAALVRPKSD
jgi:MFS family permease